VIAGYHAGLADGMGEAGGGRSLTDRLSAEYAIKPFHRWEARTADLPLLEACRAHAPPSPSVERGFERAFLTRMLFSCLVDADYLATEQFYVRADGRESVRGGSLAPAMLDRLRSAMAVKRRDDTAVNRLRAKVRDHAVARRAQPTAVRANGACRRGQHADVAQLCLATCDALRTSKDRLCDTGHPNHRTDCGRVPRSFWRRRDT